MDVPDDARLRRIPGIRGAGPADGVRERAALDGRSEVDESSRSTGGINSGFSILP
ncbi:MAG: hypothetical protein HC767_14540 [Akkermansiaceae bacterium]|nr:hypothetical protein [Akkermansiaceae bacterium]